MPNVHIRKKSATHVTFKTEREMAAWMAKKIAGAKKEVIIVDDGWMFGRRRRL